VAILIFLFSNNGENNSLESQKKIISTPPTPSPKAHTFSEKTFAKLQKFAKKQKPLLPIYNWFYLSL
jgi:hypothetical protein